MDPKLSPSIRSNEFSGNWEQKKFGEIYQVNNERNEGQYPVNKTLSIATMTFNSLGNGAEESSLSKYKVLRIGDIAFEGHTSKKFRYGRFVLNNIENGICLHGLQHLGLLLNRITIFGNTIFIQKK